MSTPGDRIFVAQSLDHGLVKINDWCRLWGMRNAGQTRAMIVSKSHTAFPLSRSLIIDMTVSVKSANVTGKKHVAPVSMSVSQKLSIMHRDWGIFRDHLLQLGCRIVTSFICL